MTQSILVTLISIFLYLSSLLSGIGSSPSSPPAESPKTAETAQVPTSGVVTGNTVMVYKSTDSRDIVATLQRGDYVDILHREGSWYKVRLISGETGYVTTFTLMPADSPPVVENPATAARRRVVLGYYVVDQRLPSRPSLENYSHVLTAISPWTWEITASGGLVASFGTAETGQALKLAGERGLSTYALIHNFALNSKGLQNFNATLVNSMLSNPDARRKLVQNILATLKSWQFTGVHIDFEMVMPSDRYNLQAFLKELYNTLHPAGFEVTMAVPAKDRESVTNSWSGAYDYSALHPYLDLMMLMTYDEHWRGGAPGPVASLPWVESVVRFALNEGVPPEKIVLGVAGYGYDWPRQGQARAVTYTQAITTAKNYGAQIQWDATAKVPYFHYGDGRQVWFESRQSLSYKLGLVNKYGLAGISLWRLGQEDPGSWQIIQDMFS
ncbi:MAG TPA: SH3 domain-containing protein [Firmicutes bacterium]|nr:SH3 domain-containing protein [Bacillota bacterium]